VFVAALALLCRAAAVDDQQFNGRWDITVNGISAPQRGWWLEVSGAGGSLLKGRFMSATVGLLDEIPKPSISEGELRFAIDGRYRKDKNVEKGLYWARLEDGKLKGTFEIEGDASSYLEWVGVRAPALADKDDGTWKRGDPVTLFNGKDLSGWQNPAPPTPKHPGPWIVKDGILSGIPIGSNLISDKKFLNFALEVEFRIPPRGNSGIGLRGRYEVQIADDFDRPASNRISGAILGRIAPTQNAAGLPDQWQTLTVRLVGRQVSVILNGLRVIDKQSIDGPTVIALDTDEADPGPIVLQGDRGAIEFRKIVVFPLVKRP
jgi:hypothetical protein